LLIDENSKETQVFYHKMKGDYCRYISEAVDYGSDQFKGMGLLVCVQSLNMVVLQKKKYS